MADQNSPNSQSEKDAAAKAAQEEAARKKQEEDAAAAKKKEEEDAAADTEKAAEKSGVEDAGENYNPYEDGDVKSSYLADVIATELKNGESPTLAAIKGAKKKDEKDK